MPYIEFQGPEFGAFRVPKGATGGNRPGTYTGAGNYAIKLYGQLAKELQEEVAGIIEAERSVREKNPRKENPKGTLARVTMDRRNKDVTNLGFQVGNQNFLARSNAKYYRIIEEGSAVAAPKYTTSMITVASAKNGRRMWMPRGGAPGTQYPIPARADKRVATLPRNPIEPLYAYSRAWERINTSGRLLRIWRQILVDAGLVSGRGGPLPQRFSLGNIDY